MLAWRASSRTQWMLAKTLPRWKPWLLLHLLTICIVHAYLESCRTYACWAVLRCRHLWFCRRKQARSWYYLLDAHRIARMEAAYPKSLLFVALDSSEPLLLPWLWFALQVLTLIFTFASWRRVSSLNIHWWIQSSALRPSNLPSSCKPILQHYHSILAWDSPIDNDGTCCWLCSLVSLLPRIHRYWLPISGLSDQCTHGLDR